MTKKEFWIRLSAWITCALLVPIGYLCYKYRIFQPTDTAETASYKLTGWGVLAIIVISCFVISMAREALHGLPKGSMIRQCITGFLKLVPILALIFLLESIERSIGAFKEFLIVFWISNAVAVPINPLPKWAQENNVEYETHALVNAFRRIMNSGGNNP